MKGIHGLTPPICNYFFFLLFLSFFLIFPFFPLFILNTHTHTHIHKYAHQELAQSQPSIPTFPLLIKGIFTITIYHHLIKCKKLSFLFPPCWFSHLFVILKLKNYCHLRKVVIFVSQPQLFYSKHLIKGFLFWIPTLKSNALKFSAKNSSNGYSNALSP